MKRARISSPDFNVMGSTSLDIIEAQIIYIELLEGSTIKTDPEVIQYVNIQQNEEIHLDDDVVHTDRFGRYLRCKVKFDREGVFNFKVKLVPDRKNSWYSLQEKERNKTFKHTDMPVDFVTNENGEKIIELGELSVTPAGGDVFTIIAKDAYRNEVQASAKVKNERLLYYVEIKMKRLRNATSNLDIFKEEYAKHNIKLKKLPSLKISHISNVDCQDVEPFIEMVEKKYRRSNNGARDPYVICLVYTDQLAVQGEGVLKYRNAERSLGHIALNTYDYNRSAYNYLWKDLDSRNWFVECYYIVNDEPTRTKVRIPKKRCRAGRTATDYTGDGMYNQINIDVSILPKDKKCEIVLTVKWVDCFCGGFSIQDANIIAIATRAMWTVLASDQKLQEIAIHEVGHQVGMVPNGLDDDTNKSKLNRTPFYYDHTHIGNHCERPNTCVMYGALRNLHCFCPVCAKSLKKIDLGNGVKGV